MTPVLTLHLSSNALRPIYRVLFSKLHINRNFLVVMISLALAAGRLRLKLLETEQGLKALS